MSRACGPRHCRSLPAEDLGGQRPRRRIRPTLPGTHEIKSTMSRYVLVAAVSVLSPLLATGCGTSTPRDHDKLICTDLARGVSKPGNAFSSALAMARKAVRTRGYLTPQMTTDLRSVIESSGGGRYRALHADCQAVGVDGQLWRWPISY
jgi:hypothetical protein